MSKRISLMAAALLIFSAVSFVAAQTTTTTVTQTPTTVTKTVQHPDGTFTVIEYPVGKEVQLNLNPVTLTKGKGVATILRDDNGTRVLLNLTDVPADVTAVNLYAVDETGAVTSLGPVTVTNGIGTLTATTPLNKFMLIAAPDAALTTYDPNTKVFFRSAVPPGFSVIPHATSPVAITATTTPATGVTQTVNADGTFSVIEYPVGREITLNLNPVTITGAKGVATVLRDDNGTRIKLNFDGLPSNIAALNLYAVDPTGAVTLLGPVNMSNGVGTFTATTPLDKFMLVASPEAALTMYDANTKVFFRSAVPEGFAVIPHTTVPLGERVSATAAGTSPVYKVPMLNIPAYEKGDDTKIKVNFTGELAGARANVFITPRKGDATKVKLRFHELKDAPAGRVYTLWAVGADDTFARLGQIVNTGKKNEAEIESSVTLPDFGLLVTTEDAAAVTTLVRPVGPAIGIFEIVR